MPPDFRTTNRTRVSHSPDMQKPGPAESGQRAQPRKTGKGESMRAFGFVCWCLVAGIGVIGTADGARAQSAAEFFRSKELTILVGSDSGGGYDTYARAMAR